MFELKDTMIVEILKKLQMHGESALFGGYIRDTLLNIKPNDIDICTTLSSDDVLKLFTKSTVRDTLSGHKVISINMKNIQIEISTDAPSLEEKAKNSDLNINSLVYDGQNLLDFNSALPDFGGKIIKNIDGSYIDKINVSPFLWLKPFRLAGTTGFSLHSELLSILKNTSYHLEKINKGILNQESYKIIDSNYSVNALNYLAEIGLISKFDMQDMQLHLNAPLFKKNYHLRLAYLAKLTSTNTIDDFIDLFQMPTLIKVNYSELINVLNGVDYNPNYKLLNEKMLLERMLNKK